MRQKNEETLRRLTAGSGGDGTGAGASTSGRNTGSDIMAYRCGQECGVRQGDAPPEKCPISFTVLAGGTFPATPAPGPCLEDGVAPAVLSHIFQIRLGMQTRKILESCGGVVLRGAATTLDVSWRRRWRQAAAGGGGRRRKPLTRCWRRRSTWALISRSS